MFYLMQEKTQCILKLGQKREAQSYCDHHCGVREVGQIPAPSQEVYNGAGEQTRVKIRLESI